jgi:hypothetical protein
MMGTEWFPETLCFLSELTRLTAREDFITSCRRESFKSHIAFNYLPTSLAVKVFLNKTFPGWWIRWNGQITLFPELPRIVLALLTFHVWVV